MQTVGLKSGDLGDAERRIQTTWEVNLSASIITQIQQIPNVCPCRILLDETGLQSILTKPITTDNGPCFQWYVCVINCKGGIGADGDDDNSKIPLMCPEAVLASI